MGRPGRKPVRDLMRGAHQLIVVHDAIDHAPRRRVFGRYRVGEHHERSGARFANEAGQKPGPSRIRNKREPRERLDEPRRAGGEHNVAGKRDIGPGAGGHAVDRADDWLRQTAQRSDERIVAFVESLAEVGADAVRRDRAVGQVLAGAESLASAAEQHDSAVVTGGGPFQRFGKAFMQGDGEGVEPVGPVQRQVQDAPFERLEQDRRRRLSDVSGHAFLSVRAFRRPFLTHPARRRIEA